MQQFKERDMQQKNPAEVFFESMQSGFKKILEVSPVTGALDIKTMMEAQRKNMQAVADANRLAFQNWQDMARRQAEMVSQFVQDNAEIARDALSADAPQDRFARQADTLKTTYEKSFLNTQELTDMMRKSTIDTADVINQRVLTAISELKNTAKKDAA
jgi:phasin family protein